MLEFFGKLERKRAFKKALKEIDLEDAAIPKGPHTENTKVTRVYQTGAPKNIENQVVGKSKFTNSVRRSETTAVDLKNFKDWRKINKVDSKNPETIKSEEIKKQDKIKNDNTSQYVTPQKQTLSSIDIISKTSSPVSRSEDIDNNFNNYLKEKEDRALSYKELVERFTAKKASKKVEPTNLEVKETIENNIDTNKDEAIQEKSNKLPNQDVPEPVQVEPEELAEPVFKVEVVVPETPEVKPKKPVTKRKPRGKSKRRFDADVISSVDWK